MTDNREIIEMLKMLKEQALKSHNDTAVLEVKIDSFNFVLDEAIGVLEQQPCEDCISRQVVLDMLEDINAETEGVGFYYEHYVKYIKALPSVAPKENTGHCKDCKWWKDNDGVYRRGIGAESKCPINRKEVYEGNGYCFMFEP